MSMPPETFDGVLPDPRFWKGKRVVLTGHTGFKGGWLAIWLARMGAVVTGISLAPNSEPSLFEAAGVRANVDHHICDIRDARATGEILLQSKPDIVFHLAAQALVRESYANPVDTWSTNVMGTVNVLDALRASETTKVAVMVTTDKVYHNREWHYPYREGDELGGHDPYSGSKAASEIAIASYRLSYLEQHGIAIASARAGNVIGGGDWSRDRLVPDAIRAWQNDDVLSIRRPDAVRPWQHVLEPVSAYLMLAERLWADPALAGAYNIGPDSSDMASVRTVVNIARKVYGRGQVDFAETVQGPHEAGLLALETAKIRQLLGVAPRWALAEAVTRTIEWYRDHHQGASAYELCCSDIARFGTIT